jgi:serine/threonine protein kinase
MMVMELKEGSLRQHLDNNFISLNWVHKLRNLQSIASGLKKIHQKGLIHRDFHCGNILSDFNDMSFITDLGLCRPANTELLQSNDNKVYGVLPYVAPEVLRGKEYTQASDIYGFGIIAYEICTGLPPYHNVAHDEFLTIKICQGLRPNSTNYKIPQILFEIINKCWDANPLKRPKAVDLYNLLCGLYSDIYKKLTDPTIDKQIKEVDEINEHSSYLSKSPLLSAGTLSYITHPQAIYTSRLLDFKNLPEPKNADDNNDNSFGMEYLGNYININYINKLYF